MTRPVYNDLRDAMIVAHAQRSDLRNIHLNQAAATILKAEIGWQSVSGQALALFAPAGGVVSVTADPYMSIGVFRLDYATGTSTVHAWSAAALAAISAAYAAGVRTVWYTLDWEDRETPTIPVPEPDAGRWNARCGCGKRGYLGFSRFECENPFCESGRPA